MKNIGFLFLFLVACTTSKKSIPAPNSFWAAHQKDLYENDRAPLKKDDLKNLRYYMPDDSYKVIANFARFNDGTPFEMATYAGTTKTYVKFGSLLFTLHGEELELPVYQSQSLKAMDEYKNYLFLPFKDLTSGGETYGGGRYIDLEITDIKEGRVVLDFNHAYNPWCAYKDGYSCPIPPKANILNIAIKAGEKLPVGSLAH